MLEAINQRWATVSLQVLTVIVSHKDWKNYMNAGIDLGMDADSFAPQFRRLAHAIWNQFSGGYEQIDTNAIEDTVFPIYSEARQTYDFADAPNFTANVERMVALARQRKLAASMLNAIERMEFPLKPESVAEIGNELFEQFDTALTGVVHLESDAEAVDNLFDAQSKELRGRPVSIGIAAYDEINGGLHPQSLLAIIGGYKTMKTRLATNAIIQMLRQFSAESRLMETMVKDPSLVQMAPERLYEIYGRKGATPDMVDEAISLAHQNKRPPGRSVAFLTLEKTQVHAYAQLVAMVAIDYLSEGNTIAKHLKAMPPRDMVALYGNAEVPMPHKAFGYLFTPDKYNSKALAWDISPNMLNTAGNYQRLWGLRTVAINLARAELRGYGRMLRIWDRTPSGGGIQTVSDLANHLALDSRTHADSPLAVLVLDYLNALGVKGSNDDEVKKMQVLSVEVPAIVNQYGIAGMILVQRRQEKITSTKVYDPDPGARGGTAVPAMFDDIITTTGATDFSQVENQRDEPDYNPGYFHWRFWGGRHNEQHPAQMRQLIHPPTGRYLPSRLTDAVMRHIAKE